MAEKQGRNHRENPQRFGAHPDQEFRAGLHQFLLQRIRSTRVEHERFVASLLRRRRILQIELQKKVLASTF